MADIILLSSGSSFSTFITSSNCNVLDMLRAINVAMSSFRIMYLLLCSPASGSIQYLNRIPTTLIATFDIPHLPSIV